MTRRPRIAPPGVGRRCRVALLALAVAGAGLGPLSAVALPAAVPAGQGEREGTVTADVALRAEPDKGAPSLAGVPDGARVAIVGRAEDGYYPVRYDGIDGWIATGYLAASLDDDPPARDEPDRTVTADRSDRDASADRTDSTDAESDRTGNGARSTGGARRSGDASDDVIATEELNLRADPTDAADVLRTIAAGDEVVPTGERDGDYVEVRHDGDTGWVAFAFLATRRAPTPAKIDRSPAREPGGPDSEGNARNMSEAELIRLISEAADYYGQPRQDMLRVARCESELTPTAVNPRTGDSGLFQFNPNTWLSTPYAEYDIFDPRASAYAAGWMWSVGRRNEWVCQ